MAFKKGDPKPDSSGRRKGVKNKKVLPKIGELLADAGINPVQKIIDLIPDLTPREQMQAWLELQSYLQAKPKAESGVPITNTETESNEDLSGKSDEELLKLIKP